MSDPYEPSIPAGLRGPFKKWWRKHPKFSHQFDWQKLVVEAWREGAAEARNALGTVSSAATPAPTAEEIVEALQEHPRLAHDVKALLYKLQIEEMEAHPDHWMAMAKAETRAEADRIAGISSDHIRPNELDMGDGSEMGE